MPHVKIKRRSKKFRFMKSVKTMLFVVLISSAIGMAAVLLTELFSPSSTGRIDIVSMIIKRYKDNYGDNWKSKLKEDYGTYESNNK